MKALQKVSKFLSDYTSIVVIAIAVITFLVPGMMSWVNYKLFVDFVANKFTNQSIIIGIIMFSMGLTLTAQDFKILAKTLTKMYLKTMKNRIMLSLYQENLEVVDEI